MRRPLFPLTALAPAQVWSRSYVQGSGALTTRGPSWSGGSVAMAACDEPAASSVALPAGVAPLPAGDTPPPTGVAPSAVNCDGRVKTGGGCVNCDTPTSSACCGAPSMVVRMSLYPNSSQASWSSAAVSKVLGQHRRNE
jgi:hypothetical protein